MDKSEKIKFLHTKHDNISIRQEGFYRQRVH